MALVRFGGGIVQMSGSIAGDTFARNRYGNYNRARTKPTNPNTWGQVKIRASISYLSEYWFDSLSAAERAAWATYAANVAMKNKLGETIHLSGFNHFIRCNSNRNFNAQTVIDAAPVIFDLAAKDETISIDCDESPQTITVTFDLGRDWLSETGAYMHLRQGLPQNGSRTFFAGPWRHVGVILGSSSPWTTPVPFTPVIAMASGQRQWCAFRISRLDGRLSEIFIASAIVHGSSPGEVPNLLGNTQEQAIAALTNVQLILGNVTTVINNNVPIDHIISSFPVAHEKPGVGSAVDLVISLGGIAVPDILGGTQAEAVTLLTTAQLVLGIVTTAYHDTVPIDRIISSDPVAGTGVNAGDPVNIVVSLGPAG